MSATNTTTRQQAMTGQDVRQRKLLTRQVESTGHKVSSKDYCSVICGAKCCYVRHEGEIVEPCPNLKEDKLCAIYKQRYEKKEPYSFVSIKREGSKLIVLQTHCGHIIDLIHNKRLPKEVEDQCCYAHPDLLDSEEVLNELCIRQGL